ncbi:MAG: hypothetical protein F6K28_15960 [Microcoleus sp. SIO2G3]|nr:hypothetical protein [Microcoleus sp. SIO2G3]
MKQILSTHGAVWRSIAICTVAGVIIVVDNQVAPTEPVQADSYAYSKVDQHCISGILRGMAIDLPTAAHIEASADQPIEAAGLAGMQPYCWLANKTAPNGAWSQAAILPIDTGAIAAPPQVLVVYFSNRASDNVYTVTGTERWDVAPDNWREQLNQPPAQQAVQNAWNWAQDEWRTTQPRQSQPQPLQEACR